MFNFFILFYKFNFILKILEKSKSIYSVKFITNFMYIKKIDFFDDKFFFFKHHEHEVKESKKINTKINFFYDYLYLNKLKEVRKKNQNDLIFVTIAPEFQWTIKIKDSKNYLKNYFNITNNLFKKFVKKHNNIQLNYYSNTIYNFFIWFLNENVVNLTKSISIFINGNCVKDYTNILKKNDVITFHSVKYAKSKFFFTKILEPKNHKNHVFKNSIEVSLLSNSVLILKKENYFFLESNLNILNWKSYCWKTTKKFH